MKRFSHKVKLSWLFVIGSVILAAYSYSLQTKKQKSDQLITDTTASFTKRNSAHIIYDNQVLPKNSGHLALDDIVFTVKTGRSLEHRLNEIILTWFRIFPKNVFFITDSASIQLKIRAGYKAVVETSCLTGHGIYGLNCKMEAEFRTYIEQGRPKWWCHLDDDNYVNDDVILRLLNRYDPDKEDIYIGRASLTTPISVGYDNKDVPAWFGTGGAGFCISRKLANKMEKLVINKQFEKLGAKIQAADDVTIGFIVNHLLDVAFINSPLFVSHSGLHQPELINTKFENLRKKAILSYKKGSSVITIPKQIETRYFTEEEDETRLFTFHCSIHPEVDFCKN